MSNRCEDYPCCGHTDGLGCNYTPDYTYINLHALCDHEVGICDVWEDEEEPEWEDDDDAPFVMEDQWLDGSYEE